MLSPKPWKLEAIVRLLVSVFLCLCTGSLIVSTLYYSGPAGKGRTKFILIAIGAYAFLGYTLALLRKRWTSENLTRLLPSIMLCFYAGLVLTAWAESVAGSANSGLSVGQMLLGMFSFQGASLVLVAWFLRDQEMTWTQAFGFVN